MILTFLSGVIESGVVEAVVTTVVQAEQTGLAEFLNSLGGLVAAFTAASVPIIGILYSFSKFVRVKATNWEPMIKTLFSDASTDIKKAVIDDLHEELKDVKDAMAVLLAKAAVDTQSNIQNPVINAQLTAEYEKVSGAINKVVTTTKAVEDTVKTIVTAVNEVKEVIEQEIQVEEGKAWYE
jgi:hypothetical protein